MHLLMEFPAFSGEAIVFPKTRLFGKHWINEPMIAVQPIGQRMLAAHFCRRTSAGLLLFLRVRHARDAVLGRKNAIDRSRERELRGSAHLSTIEVRRAH